MTAPEPRVTRSAFVADLAAALTEVVSDPERASGDGPCRPGAGVEEHSPGTRSPSGPCEVYRAVTAGSAPV